MLRKVYIVGAGFGGLETAYALGKAVSEGRKDLEVTLIEKSTHFLIGATNQWNLHSGKNVNYSVPYSALKLENVQFVNDEVTKIEIPERRLTMKSGAIFEATDLVLAMGTGDAKRFSSPESSGFCVHHAGEMAPLRAAIDSATAGTIAVLVSGKPPKCPPVPFEFAFLIDDLLRQAGKREAFRIVVASPDPTPVPLENPQPFTALCKAKDIEFRGKIQPTGIADKTIQFEWAVPGQEGQPEALSYDVLVEVTKQTAPKVLKDTGLTNPLGLIPADTATLRTQWPGVYAIGDNAHLMLPTTPPKPHPKAGGFSLRHAEKVAQNILDSPDWATPAAHVQDKSSAAGCPSEIGGGMQVVLDINLHEVPSKPQFTVSEPYTTGPTKYDWVRGVLARYFDEAVIPPSPYQ